MNAESVCDADGEAGDVSDRSTHSFRYLQIITATFSQFFLVGQKTRQECVGMTSVTRAMMWSGSIFCIVLEYCGPTHRPDRLSSTLLSCSTFILHVASSPHLVEPQLQPDFNQHKKVSYDPLLSRCTGFNEATASEQELRDRPL